MIHWPRRYHETSKPRFGHPSDWDKWISEKAMPGHKIGRLWKFKKNEIDE
jgi:hypothetical protein